LRTCAELIDVHTGCVGLVDEPVDRMGVLVLPISGRRVGDIEVHELAIQLLTPVRFLALTEPCRRRPKRGREVLLDDLSEPILVDERGTVVVKDAAVNVCAATTRRSANIRL
jgi:hypothetical protein